MKKIALVLIVIFIAMSLGCGSFTAFATTDNYSDVLDDLQQDETFNVDNYPAIATPKKEMDVFQVAESVDGEVFLYIYQPLEDKFTASEARISTSIGENISPKDYKLTLLSRRGTLAKYLVNDLQVSPDIVRYYVIIQVARPWDKNVDKGTGNDNTINTVTCNISKRFTACTDKDGDVSYSELHEETIEITAKYCGYIRNFIGWQLVTSADIDSHFIAFDTNRQIDRLMEATVTYECYAYTDNVNLIFGTRIEKSRGEVYSNTATVKADESHTIPAYGLFGNEYSWTEIESRKEFLARDEVPADVRDKIADKPWVLRFATMPFIKLYPAIDLCVETGIRVSNTSIVELTFETDGVVYNLGVVDNKQTEGDKPISSNDPLEWWKTFLDDARQWFVNAGNWLSQNWWVIIVFVLGVIIIVSLSIKILREGLWLILKAIAKGIWIAIKYLFIGLYYIFASPVYLIAWIVRKIKDR